MLYVIMSVYRNDSSPHLREAVESILDQSYTEFKFYIICDGPVQEEVGDYLSNLRDERVEIRRRSANKGLAISLNELLEEILEVEDCEFVARMDADDYSLPERFHAQINYLRSHLDTDIVGSFIKESSEPTKNIGAMVTYPIDHTGCRQIFGKRNPVAHPSVMFRKSYFDKAGLYPTDTMRAEDDGLWLKGFKSGCTFSNIPQVLIRMRVNDDFYERRNSKEKVRFDYDFRKKIIRELRLPKVNYTFAFARYALFRYAPAWLLKYAYLHLRPKQ